MPRKDARVDKRNQQVHTVLGSGAIPAGCRKAVATGKVPISQDKRPTPCKVKEAVQVDLLISTVCGQRGLLKANL